MLPEAWLDETPPALRELRFAILDFETTGGSPKAAWKEDRFLPAAEITEVGLVRLTGSIREDSFDSLCAVEGEIPPFIQRLTGITHGMLLGAPTWERVALRLAEMLEGRLWVAHHAPFDGAFLKTYLPEGLWKRHALLCTRQLAKCLVPEAKSCSLGSLCEVLQLHNRRPHRALADAEATAELMQVLIERAEARGMSTEAFLAKGRVTWERI